MFSDFFIQQIAQSLKDEQKKLPPSEAPFSDVRLEEAEPPNSLTKSGMLCCLNVHYLIHSFTIHSLNIYISNIDTCKSKICSALLWRYKKKKFR